jgi:gamma-glutamyltranspeptidase/glutathione hydrolase
VQTDLAETLRAIANHGPRAFYEGAVADKIVAAVRAAGGIFAKDDLKNYRPQIRAPVRGSYRGHEILSMPPPSSGGIVLVETLNILEGYRLDAPSTPNLHILIEAMKRAYADRARHLGDPDAVEIPKNLTSKAYAARLREGIGERATASSQLQAPREGANTTHFSVIDREGNAVASTYTLNFSYGLGLVAEGTGVLLNNELDDFTAKPGAANAFGLVGYDANLPAPGKRPLSSMSPTIVLKDGKPVLLTGSPGGSRIISTVLQVIVNSIDFNMAIDRAVSAPRLHHQWMPDVVDVEPGFAAETLTALQTRGHRINPRAPSTSANSLAVTPQGYVGAADPRTRGALAVGY